MFEQMAAGEIKACWIICTNPVATVANRRNVIAGLEAAELVITQDAYADTATNRYADIMLPATLWAESDAVMVNSDRNLTLLQQSIPPAGSARPDWELICQVAEHLGYGEHFAFKSSEQIFDEIRRFHNPRTGWDLRGASYERLRQTPLQWPVPPDDPQDRHPIRYLNDGVSQDLFVDESGRRPRLAFATPSRRAVFHPRPHLDPAELPDDEYPMVLNNGRLQHQWHTMTKTGRVAKLNKLNSGPFVEIHPDDALVHAVTDGQPVELVSRRGRAVLPAVVTDRVRPGNLWAPFHWNDEHGEFLAVNAADQRRGRSALAAAGVQGVRGEHATREDRRGRLGNAGTRASACRGSRRCRASRCRRWMPTKSFIWQHFSQASPAERPVCRYCRRQLRCVPTSGCGWTACSPARIRGSALPLDRRRSLSPPVRW